MCLVPQSAEVTILNTSTRNTVICFVLLATFLGATATTCGQDVANRRLEWSELPSLPNELGVAGPFVGVHNGALLVAGGANFPLPVWEQPKQWHATVYVMQPNENGYEWKVAGALQQPVAYGASVSTPQGVVCIGGNDAQTTFARCFLLQWNAEEQRLATQELPSLPLQLAYGQAGLIGNIVYVAGGQTTAELNSAVSDIWSLDLSQLDESDCAWRKHNSCPGPPRAFNIVAVQNNGFDDCLYMIGGRHAVEGRVVFLEDCWEYNPKMEIWRERASLPQPVTAGTGIDYGQSHIFVLSGDDGSNFHRTEELLDQHPGFPKMTWGYHTITDTWIELGPSPANQVTTLATKFDGAVVLPTGEVRPRVRTPKVWRIEVPKSQGAFGTVDYVVLFLYLLSLIGIGLYFMIRTKNTDDYFRAAGQIPWWAAGCSIFATMLSSLTFTGVPSKAFAQDWVYAVGNFMIPVVAVLAVYVALPFYRNIDATSAYEYLEKRFHRSVRLFGSLCFSTFHVFRMAIVMSLTGLALAVATPLTPAQSVLLMGVLSILYCSMGGISAVIWTDTLQTVVLLGGALVAIIWLLAGTGSSVAESFETASHYGKLNMANWHFRVSDAQVAFWAIVLGAIGQNTASYTADQAVVQRYMTTKSESSAAMSIWTNAVLAVPATILFFGMGTALFLYYRAHPERLDPSMSTDQIFPMFISRELPVGLAGLIVAAIFAAAQSTVSTSMNSVATTLVTDCIRPLKPTIGERKLLFVAQMLTVILGIAGTSLALAFISPDIRSLFDQFIKVIGLFMGVLGGLFVLGVCFPRANTVGAWVGTLVASGTMIYVWTATTVNGYLYTLIGIITCVVVGRLSSSFARPPQSIEAFTIQRKHIFSPIRDVK